MTMHVLKSTAPESYTLIVSESTHLSTEVVMTTEHQSTSIEVISSTDEDCECIGKTNISSGVYEINVNGNSVKVYCKMIHGYNWMVIFRRTVGNVVFDRVWTNYENGFGYINGDFWIGLNNLSYFTNTGLGVMRVEMDDIDGYSGYAQYSNFLVGDTSTKYKLSVAGYGGTSGCTFY
ncbi:fibrinogen-like protein 1 [Saccostrea echinata]|uniref:fibrinogen-like protein 1 n=1 Tax=Saccostrea echinata TaxID=191078 RepID=UPI002A83A915|nr:fibrinogen-like protein 1 [Saccostrea echinata]